MPPSTELIALFRSKGYAAAVSGAGPCVLVLHYGNAREAIDQIASERLLPAIGVCFTCPSTPPASKSSVAKSRRRLPLAGAGRRRPV